MVEIARTVQNIQYVLAPAVMVSSSALLLLGFQNKFSSLASRFRVLNQEKRALFQKAKREKTEDFRLENLTKQIANLMQRAGYVKSAIVLAYAAIVCFSCTSILIFLNLYASFQLYHLIISLFLAGLLFILISAILIILETNLLYHIIVLESQS